MLWGQRSERTPVRCLALVETYECTGFLSNTTYALSASQALIALPDLCFTFISWKDIGRPQVVQRDIVVTQFTANAGHKTRD